MYTRIPYFSYLGRVWKKISDIKRNPHRSRCVLGHTRQGVIIKTATTYGVDCIKRSFQYVYMGGMWFSSRESEILRQGSLDPIQIPRAISWKRGRKKKEEEEEECCPLGRIYKIGAIRCVVHIVSELPVLDTHTHPEPNQRKRGGRRGGLRISIRQTRHDLCVYAPIYRDIYLYNGSYLILIVCFFLLSYSTGYKRGGNG